jgi:hypothetical protein
MKKSLLLFTLFVALLWVTQSCNDDQQRSTVPRDVSFSLGLMRGADASGRTTSEIPEGADVVITMSKADGTPVLSQEHITILHMGGGLVTAPIRLEPGDYAITDFWVVQDSSEVLFLIPKAGSPMASHVSKPVPFNFSVDADGVTNISVQVLSTQNQEPEDFGYVSFNLSVVDVPVADYFRVAVFAETEGGLMLTDAEAIFIETFGPFATRSLEANVNIVEEGGDLNFGRGFTFRINKPGYVSFEAYMNLSAIETYKTVPLQVVLEKAAAANSPSMVIGGGWMTGPQPELSFRMEGAGVFYVEWGNGFIEKFTFNGGTLRERYNFDDSGPRTITVRGDLDKIVSMEIVGLVAPGLTALNIHALPNLRYFRFGEDFMGMNDVVEDLDLSSQTKLDSISLEYHEAHVILPSQHNLQYVNVNYWKDDFSVFVGNIYANAVAKNIRNGFFRYQYPTNNQLPQDAVEKLIALAEHYDWNVSFN